MTKEAQQGLFTVCSSNGVLTARCSDGQVITVEVYPEGDNHLMQIVRIDIAEWERHYNQKVQPDDSIDILCAGYWYIDWRKGPEEIYEPPISEYRNEIEGKYVMG
jgi:hypothetical protein